MRLINEHESLLKNFPVSQLRDANASIRHLQYVMLSYLSKCRGLPLNWNGFVQSRFCHSGCLASGDHYPISRPDQFSPGKCTSLGPAYSSYHHGLWTAGYYLFSWLRLGVLQRVKKSRPLVAKRETNKSQVQNGESPLGVPAILCEKAGE